MGSGAKIRSKPLGSFEPRFPDLLEGGAYPLSEAERGCV